VRQDRLPPDTEPQPAEAKDDIAGASETERADGDRRDDAIEGEGPSDSLGEATGDTAQASAGLVRASWSPLAATADTPVLRPPLDPWRDAARALVRRVQRGRSRRWRPAARHGRRFDLRRTLRTSLHTGGEALTPRWLEKPRRSPRFVALIDGSRSMRASVQPALQVALALAGVTSRVEVFTFSTTLRRVTPDVRAACAGATGRPANLRPWGEAWGGGTAIGASLRAFVTTAGERLLGRDTLVIVASDGLDVGDAGALRDVMRDLHRRSAGIVWLNPLLATPGYEPTAVGMRAARPFVTTFACVADAQDLARLARVVRLRQ
jgi:uncharacterized protein with von Willebrand factor type A (vWA) domain